LFDDINREKKFMLKVLNLESRKVACCKWKYISKWLKTYIKVKLFNWIFLESYGKLTLLTLRLRLKLE